MKKIINATHIEGYAYEHKLQLKVTGENSKNPGTPFIRGKLKIATDEALTNIVDLTFTYVIEKFNSGKVNETFTILKDIIDGTKKTVMSDGKENAVKLKIDSAIGLNDFYDDRDELVSVKINDGGFIHLANELDPDEKKRNTFSCDIIITNVIEQEADEELGTPDKAIIKGATFNFRNDLLPIELSAVNPRAIEYFMSLDASAENPVFTSVKGLQISEVIVKTIEEESAFGENSVREVRNSRKDYVITWAAKEPYLWDDEDTITKEELTKAIANREVHLATVKQQKEDYKKNKAANTGNNFAISSEKGAPKNEEFRF